MNDIENKILADYKNIKPFLEDWGSKVDNYILQNLQEYLSTNHIQITPKYRLKSEKSLISKALYRAKTYNSPLIEIEDKVATRIVLLKSDDIEKIAKLLLNLSIWSAKTTKDIKSIIEENPNGFDYQSHHLVVCPPSDCSFYTNDIIPYISCEIQIRTLLQHAFAEVSHDSTYKGPYKNDNEIIRSLSKSMALMEATDDYFCQIFAMITNDARKFRNYINELTKLYLIFKPLYNSTDLDVELTNHIFELLIKKDVPIQDVSDFVQKTKVELSDVFKNNSSFTFNQPIILLLAYYLYNNPNFLKQNWPLSSDSIHNLFQSFGYAFDSY